MSEVSKPNWIAQSSVSTRLSKEYREKCNSILDKSYDHSPDFREFFEDLIDEVVELKAEKLPEVDDNALVFTDSEMNFFRDILKNRSNRFDYSGLNDMVYKALKFLKQKSYGQRWFGRW